MQSALNKRDVHAHESGPSDTCSQPAPSLSPSTEASPDDITGGEHEQRRWPWMERGASGAQAGLRLDGDFHRVHPALVLIGVVQVRRARLGGELGWGEGNQIERQLHRVARLELPLNFCLLQGAAIGAPRPSNVEPPTKTLIRVRC